MKLWDTEENRKDRKIWLGVVLTPWTGLGFSSSSMRPCLMYMEPWHWSQSPQHIYVLPTTFNQPYTPKGNKQPKQETNWAIWPGQWQLWQGLTLCSPGWPCVLPSELSVLAFFVHACVRALALQSQAVSCELHDVVPRTTRQSSGRAQGRLPLSLDDTVSLQESSKTWCGCCLVWMLLGSKMKTPHQEGRRRAAQWTLRGRVTRYKV